MADFNGATQIDLTPQALAMIRLIQAGQGNKQRLPLRDALATVSLHARGARD